MVSELHPEPHKPTIEHMVLTTLMNSDGSLGRQSGLIIDHSNPEEPQVIGSFAQEPQSLQDQ